MSVHRRKLKDAVMAAGVHVTVDPREPHDLAVHVQIPNRFSPIPGDRNLLFTATELTEPLAWGNNVSEAVMLVVPCEYSRKVCQRYFPGPVEVCPEGIDPALFRYHERSQPGPGPFRFLFVGNGGTISSRKGMHIVMEAWKEWFFSGRMPPNAELYLKTSDMPGPELQTFGPPKLPFGMTVDTRILSVHELVALYNGAHAFVLPSQGEGWGLTLTDAMATGLPCAWTHWSAMLDYGDETVGYPVTDFRMVPMIVGADEPGANSSPAFGAEVSTTSLIRAMHRIYRDYDHALQLGRAASERMHALFTWGQSAERFIKICERALSLPIVPTIARIPL